MSLILALTAPSAASWAAAPAEPAAVRLTILVGEATVIRGAAKSPLAEGVQLRENDIVESTADARLVRLELAGGATLDLGPSTRLMLLGRRPGKAAPPGLAAHLLLGWIKWTSGPAPLPGDRLSVSGLDIDSVDRSVVVRVLPAAADRPAMVAVFAESGQARLQTRGGGPPQTLSLQTGEFAVLTGGAPPKVLPRPNPDFSRFARELPPMLADTLPGRLDRWKNRTVDLRPGVPVAYADVVDWLHADRTDLGTRAAFPARWKARLQDPAFGKSMLTDLALHPEWRPLLVEAAPHPRPPVPVPHAPAASLPLRDGYNR